MNKLQFVIYVCFGFLILFLYKSWFLSSSIIGGDWPYMYQETINSLSFLPPAWDPTRGNGLGGTFLVYALDSYLYFTGWFFSHTLHIPWSFVYKFFYFGLFLILSVFSVWYSLKKFLPQVPSIYRLLGIFLYVANSYILLVVSGGQMGIALAYSITPLVLASFIKAVDIFNLQPLNFKFLISNFKLPIIAGIIFSVQVMFDVRLAYITIGAAIVYIVIKSSSFAKGFPLRFGLRRDAVGGTQSSHYFLNALRFTLYALVIPLGITGLLHAFWLLPLLFVKAASVQQQLGDIYTTAGAVKFFSFARLENAFGLLHPNWPENIFGKVSFMRWEFLLLPILAFSSLLFVGKRKSSSHQVIKSSSKNLGNNLTIQQFNNSTILFFALLGLLGAFLAKGANEPFGQIYIWLFEHVPGFVMFRDPTKWYLLVAISYSVLIPFSIYSIYQWFKSKVIKSSSRKFLPFVFVLFLASYLLFLIRPALLGELGGTFKPREVPVEYVALKDTLINDQKFYRTLWVPRQQRFTYSSYTHPSIEAEPLLSATDSASLAMRLQSPKAEKYLSDLGVQYIILPYDPYGEIFVDDRKYSQKKRDGYEKVLNKVEWLKRVDCSIAKLLNCADNSSGRIIIYETRQHKDLFYLFNKTGATSYTMVSPTNYEVVLKNVKKGDVLIFSENYNPFWKAMILDKKKYLSPRTYPLAPNIILNSFVLPESGDYVIKVYYSMEKYYIIGRVVSLISLIIVVVLLFISRKFR